MHLKERWPDLVRVALHHNDPRSWRTRYLPNYRRDGVGDAAASKGKTDVTIKLVSSL